VNKPPRAAWRDTNVSDDVMGIAEFIIGRAFARPVGSTHPTGSAGGESASLPTPDMPRRRNNGRYVPNSEVEFAGSCRLDFSCCTRQGPRAA